MKTTIAVDVTVDTLLDALEALILNHGGEVDRKYKFAVDDLEDMCQRYRVQLEYQRTVEEVQFVRDACRNGAAARAAKGGDGQ